MARNARSHLVPKKPGFISSIPSHPPLVIAITGTPGVGKTTLAKELSLFTNGTYVDLNKLALKGGLKAGFDRSRGVPIIDERGLYRALKPLLEPNKAYFVDSHMSHALPPSKVAYCLVIRCSLGVLRRRLLARGYSPSKVAENLEAEALGICLGEAQEAGHSLIVVDASRPLGSRALRSLSKRLFRLVKK